jgi:hypothetical protein
MLIKILRRFVKLLRLLISTFLILFLANCGGKRNIDEIPQPEIIPSTSTSKVTVVSNLIRANQVKVRDSRFLVSLSFDQYFSNGKSRRLETFLLLNFDNGEVLDSISREKVGLATCDEDDTERSIKKCSLLKIGLNPKAIRTTIDCKEKDQCPELPVKTLLTIKRFSDYQLLMSTKGDSVEVIGNIQKFVITLFPAIEDSVKAQKERLISYLGTAVANKKQGVSLSYPNRIELQQMVPHLTQGEGPTRQNTGTFPLVRSYKVDKDIFYSSFKREKTDKADLKLNFKYVSNSSLEEKEGYLLMKKVEQ